jgi:hypothetical protein
LGKTVKARIAVKVLRFSEWLGGDATSFEQVAPMTLGIHMVGH